MDGTLDPTFGDNCVSRGPIGGNVRHYAGSIALEADGGIVVSGARSVQSNNGVTDQVFVLRCNTSNPSFGFITGTSGGAVAVQPDGKILVLVRGNPFGEDCHLYRYHPTAVIDTSFGNNGISLAPDVNCNRSSIVVQPDGRIAIAGYSGANNNLAIARFNANGTVDNSFDGDGRVTTTAIGDAAQSTSLALQPDGKLVSAGYASASQVGDFVVVRFNTDGSPDNTFDGDGELSTEILAGDDRARSVTVRSDGKIVVSGEASNGSDYDFALARYNPDGSLDTSFDTDGKLTTPFFAGNDRSRVVLFQPDGKILALGNADSGTGLDFATARYNNDGSLDTSFGTVGKVIGDDGDQYTSAQAVEIQADGKIVVGGSTWDGAKDAYSLARYNPDGSLDTGFGGDGKAMTAFGILNDVAIQPDGKIVAAGFWNNITPPDRPVLIRYNTDGSLDSSFSGDGKVLAVDSIFPNAVAIQADGKIVSVGQTGTDFIVARHNADGSLDPTFDGDGKVTTEVTAYGDTPAAVAIQPDGKIVVVGSTGLSVTPRPGVVRYNPNGSLDLTFDGDGIAIPSSGPSTNLHPDSVALQSDGKIVVAGTEFGVVRFNTNGSLDTTFGGGDGHVSTSIGTGNSATKSVRIQNDGKIVVGGSATVNNRGVFAIARYNPNGTLDLTFDSDGKATFDLGQGYTLNDIALDQGNRIVAVGGNGPTHGGKFVVARIKSFQSRPFDFSGDGLAELSVYRPSNNSWYTPEANGSFATRQFGAASDILTPADFDGDGKAETAIFRPSTGQWFILDAAGQTYSVYNWGQQGDIPIPADHNGDGKADLVVFRPLNGTWYKYSIGSGPFAVTLFGIAGDKPLIGDFDGDGTFDGAVYRPSDHNWHILNSSGFKVITWGQAGDIPVPADYDGDGATDIAVWRPSIGRWYIIGSSAGWMTWNVWGVAGDVPVPADYDGDGRTDLAAFRPSNSTWYILNSSNSSIYVRQFGASGDIPIPSAFW